MHRLRPGAEVRPGVWLTTQIKVLNSQIKFYISSNITCTLYNRSQEYIIDFLKFLGLETHRI